MEWLNRAARGLELYEEAIAVLRHRFLTNVETLGFGERRAQIRSSAEGWTDDARITMLALREAMAEARTPFFLISGTLLGCVRERDILGHDKDIDVGVMETPDLDKARVEDVLRRSGQFSVKPYQSPCLLRVQHASGVLIDVFWHRMEDGLVMHEGLKSKWWNSPFTITQTEFLGETFDIPAEYDRYLSENYGDWRRPNTQFETFVDTPNMIVTNEHEMVWYYYSKLFEYFYAGKTAQLRKIWAALQRVRPNDLAVSRIMASTFAQIGDEA